MSWNTSRFIIGALEHYGPSTVAELAAAGQKSQAAIRSHLSEMVVIGTVTRQGGRPVLYALAEPDTPSPVVVPDPVEGGYRCTECGHGLKLWAWAGANISGPLGMCPAASTSTGAVTCD